MTKELLCEVTVDPEHKFLEGKFMCLASVCQDALCFFPVLRRDAAPVELYSLTVTVNFQWNGKERDGKTEGVFSLTKSNHYVRFEKSEDLDPEEVYEKVAAKNEDMNLKITIGSKMRSCSCDSHWLERPMQDRKEAFGITFGYSAALGCVACQLFWRDTEKKYVVTPFIVEILVNETDDSGNEVRKSCFHKSVSGVLTKWKPLVVKITSEDMNLANISDYSTIFVCWAVDTEYARALCPDTVCLSDRSFWFCNQMGGASVSGVIRTLMYLFLEHPSVLPTKWRWRDFLAEYYWDPGSMTEDDFEAALDDTIKDFSEFLLSSHIQKTDEANESERTVAVVVRGYGVMSIGEYKAYKGVLPGYQTAYVLKDQKQKSTSECSVLDWKPEVRCANDGGTLWSLADEAGKNGEWLFAYDKRWTILSAIATPIIPTSLHDLVLTRGIKTAEKDIFLFLRYSAKESDGFFWISSDSDIAVLEEEPSDDALIIPISLYVKLVVTSENKEAEIHNWTRHKFSWITYADNLGYLDPSASKDGGPVAVLALGKSAEQPLPPLSVTKAKTPTKYEVQKTVQMPGEYGHDVYIMAKPK